MLVFTIASAYFPLAKEDAARYALLGGRPRVDDECYLDELDEMRHRVDALSQEGGGSAPASPAAAAAEAARLDTLARENDDLRMRLTEVGRTKNVPIMRDSPDVCARGAKGCDRFEIFRRGSDQVPDASARGSASAMRPLRAATVTPPSRLAPSRSSRLPRPQAVDLAANATRDAEARLTTLEVRAARCKCKRGEARCARGGSGEAWSGGGSEIGAARGRRTHT